MRLFTRGCVFGSCIVAVLLCPVRPGRSAPAEAAPTTCARHYPGGTAPDITRPALAAQVRELCFEAFAVLHSGISRTSLAVAEHLTRRRIQQARQMERDDAFHAEVRLPEDERSRLVDYARSGFDRGHMAPSGDMPTASAQAESFSMANIVPQNPGSNRCLWEGIESAVRDLAVEEGEVWVLTGPIFEGANLQRLNERVLVPTSLWKAIYLPRQREAGAYLAPNAPGLAWRAVSLDALREVAGPECLSLATGGREGASDDAAQAAAEQHPRQLRQPAAGDGRCRTAAGTCLDEPSTRTACSLASLVLVEQTAGIGGTRPGGDAGRTDAAVQAMKGIR